GEANTSSLIQAFDGKIDEVRIYNSTISASQIAQNYNNGIPLYNTIVSDEISESDTDWIAEITINDGQTSSSDSTTRASNTINPTNSEPIHNTPSIRAHCPIDSTYSEGYWQFENNLLDETTNNNDATCTNCPTYTEEGLVGGAYNFDGVDDFINLGNDPSIYPASQLTISLWVKLDELPNTITDITQHLGDGNSKAHLRTTSDNKIYFAIAEKGSVNSNTVLTANAWYYLTAVYDGSFVRLYINGNTDGTPDSASGDIVWGTINNAQIGGQTGGTGGLLKGSFDELHIYSRALTSTEITNIYNNTSHIYYDQDLGVATVGLDEKDSDSVYSNVDWRKNDTSIATLNMSFNQDNSYIVKDFSTYKHNGNNNSSTWIANGKYGGAYDFDGTDDYIVIGDESEFDITQSNNMTVEGWFKTAESTGIKPIIGKFDYTSPDNGWYVGVNNTFLRFSIAYNDQYVNAITTSKVVNDNNWHYFAEKEKYKY
ncbi:MAG: LamG domain-containing protein, partial [Candidatus Cloacimonadota bacterium]|nr:LamG domain-containing protein [Candidatus Cloacimonadota bacterium]